MSFFIHNPPDVSQPIGGYSYGLQVKKNCSYFFVSGQIPESLDGKVPTNFDEQCELVWSNIKKILSAAGMGIDNLVKVTTFLTSQSQADANGRIRRKHLGTVQPALTVVVVQTLDSRWLLEIEAIAASKD